MPMAPRGLRPDEELHKQPWVTAAIHKFHVKQCKWEQKLCMVCHELWPSRVGANHEPHLYKCTRCKRDKGMPKLYSVENDMDQGTVPPCLQGRSQVEMLVARTCSIMSVYRKHSGQRGYNGHVVNLPQNIQGFLDQLSCNVKDLRIIVVQRQGKDDTHADFRVRRDRVCLHFSG